MGGRSRKIIYCNPTEGIGAPMSSIAGLKQNVNSLENRGSLSAEPCAEGSYDPREASDAFCNVENRFSSPLSEPSAGNGCEELIRVLAQSLREALPPNSPLWLQLAPIFRRFSDVKAERTVLLGAQLVTKSECSGLDQATGSMVTAVRVLEKKPHQRHEIEAALKPHADKVEQARTALHQRSAERLVAPLAAAQGMDAGVVAAQAMPAFAQTLQQLAQGTVAVTQQAFNTLFAQNLALMCPELHAVLFAQQTPEVQQLIMASQNATFKMLNESWAESNREQAKKDKEAQLKKDLQSADERRADDAHHVKVVHAKRAQAEADDLSKQLGYSVKARE